MDRIPIIVAMVMDTMRGAKAMALKVGIAGGGVGGLAAAIALRGLGHEAAVFEQAPAYGRVGADINLTSNAVRALTGLGVLPALLETAARPTFRISRVWDSGEETSRLELAETAVRKYGAPQLTLHRADLLDALLDRIPDGVIRLGHKVEHVEPDGGAVAVTFTNGQRQVFDAWIGADGIHSATRTALFGPEHAKYTGIVSHRGVFDRDRAPALPDLDAFVKWWGPTRDVQLATFPLTRGREIFVFATTPEPDWRHESWTTPGNIDEVRQAFAGFHPEARAYIDACTEVTKTALYYRDPLPQWWRGHAVLLGDACHAMPPFMAQGAAMAIEDAVVLARALSEAGRTGVEGALASYQQARKPRADEIQQQSYDNKWLKVGGNADWVYTYDAWSAPLSGAIEER